MKSSDGKEVIGWENIELISDRPLEVMLEEFKRLKAEFPDRVLIASIMEEYNQAAVSGSVCVCAGCGGWGWRDDWAVGWKSSGWWCGGGGGGNLLCVCVLHHVYVCVCVCALGGLPVVESESGGVHQQRPVPEGWGQTLMLVAALRARPWCSGRS